MSSFEMKWLQWSLRTLQRVFPSGPLRAAPWELVKCEVLLEKCLCSVRYLTACRRYNVLPKCVTNCSKATKLFGNSVSRLEKKFQEKILSKMIEEKYRRISHLRRRCDKLRSGVRDRMSYADASWAIGHSRCMAQCVMKEETGKLCGKLEKLKRRKSGSYGTEDVARTEERASLADTRRVVIEDSLEAEAVPATVRSLMSLGPKFVPQSRVNDGTLRSVEMGIERLAFGRRWQREAERKRLVKAEEDTNTTQEVRDERPVRVLDADVELRKIATTEKQGPLMDSIEENGLRRLKENIVRLYNKARGSQDEKAAGRVLTRQERKDLEDLARNDNIVVKPSDKSKGFVVMARSSYVEKVAIMLEDTENYERCEVTIEELDKHTRAVISKITTNKVPAPLNNALLPRNSRMSQFYGLPKDHKPGLPLRPVVSTCGSPTSNISLLLERILNQLLRFVPAHLTSTEECVEQLRGLGRLPSKSIVASLDVVSLYSNIPINESIDAAMQLLEAHRQEVDILFLSLTDVRKLLEFVLESNYFQFGDSVYRQRRGLAMGNHLAPPLAIIFMSKLEEEALSLSPQKPLLYRRYIDDCILVWLHGLELLLEFLRFMNSRHPDIRFTIEHTEENEMHTVNYLDLSVSVRDGLLSWELFIKPSHSGVHLSYDSSLPMDIKTSVAVEQFKRATRNASTDQGRQTGQEKIECLLRGNSYPKEVVDRAKQRADTRRAEYYQPSVCTSDGQQSSILKLPFVDDHLATAVRRTVRSYAKDIRVVYQSGRSLKDMLVSSRLDRPECPREVSRRRKRRGRPCECRACDAGLQDGRCTDSNVVYTMRCSVCNDEYIGETERCVRERFKEHFRQAVGRTPNTPWGRHYSSRHGQQKTAGFQPFGKAAILATEQSNVNRRILEAIFIRQRAPAVNNDCGWILLDN